jgi:tripartite ATP-independent transporter DctM subunit
MPASTIAASADQPEPHALDRLESWCVEVTRPIAFLGVIGMLIVSGVTMVDVLLRWTVASGVPALNEIVAMIFAVTVTACLPAGVAQGVNLKIDLLENLIVGRCSKWLGAFGMAMLLLFFVLLTMQITVLAGALASQGRTTVILGWPQAPFIYGVALLLAVTSAIQAIVLANSVRRALAHVTQSGARETSRTMLVWVALVGGVVLALIVYGIVDFRALSRFASEQTGWTIGLACLLLWLLLLGLVPLAAVMGLMGLVGTALFIGFPPALSAFGTEVSGFLTNSQVAVLPLFLMMGSFAAVAGIAEDVYALAHAVLSPFRGGLAMATIGGCAGFGAVTGSSVATAATIGRVALPEMRSRGYSPALSTGCVAAGGTLGNLVPPGSGPLVLFALLTEASIGQLFVASAIPSALAIGAYLLTIVLFVRLAPGSAPLAVKRHSGEIGRALKRCGPVTALFVVVLGGLYAGVFTSTEAAAVGAFGAFLVALFRGKLRPAEFWNVMTETTQTTAMIYGMIFGALTFAFFTGVSGLTETSTKFIVGLGWEPLALVSLLLVIFLVLGTFMDAYAIMIITIPIVTPLITGVGYEIVWWGVLNLFVVEIGGISPPFGLTMFVLKSVENVSMATIFKGVTPFCLAAIIALAILVLFPGVTLWLPSTMYGN